MKLDQNDQREMNKLFEAGQYQKYSQEVLRYKDKIDQDLFYYNLGLGLAKNNNLVEAGYNFLKCSKYADSRDLKNSCENLAKIVLEKRDSNTVLFNESDSRLVESHLITLVLLVVLFFLLIKKMIKKNITWPKLSILALVFVLFIGFNSYIHSSRLTMVIKSTKIYSGPSEIFSTGQSISAGTLVKVDFKDSVWCRIDDKRYVKLSDLGLL